jgi:hypothetical protein
MPDKDSNHSELLERIHHTDSRVTAMETKVDSMAGGISRIESAVLNKPPVNFAAWVGIALSIITISGGGFLLMTGYVDLTLEPLWDDVRDAERAIDKIDDRSETNASDVSVLRERIERIDHYGSAKFNESQDD